MKKGFKNMGFGAYDGYKSLEGLSPNQLDGWASKKADELGVSMWEYFKPMIPWFVVSTLVTGVVTWKVASLYCSGRLVFAKAKHSAKSGLSGFKASVSSAASSAKDSAKSKASRAKAALGLKKRKKRKKKKKTRR